MYRLPASQWPTQYRGRRFYISSGDHSPVLPDASLGFVDTISVLLDATQGSLNRTPAPLDPTSVVLDTTSLLPDATTALLDASLLLNDVAIISWYNEFPKPPADWITMTLPVLNALHKLAFICAGPSKDTALANVVLGYKSSSTRTAPQPCHLVC
ncbi:hypothetical protein PCASD_23570 [Puccinia coronata f. sp. avenae]|uniref:Glucosamine/galactosamine-6-phosphate isomerase domain-containing protein n=1 Tax=Puccinia coronata f. sp. avenae TaxID=200324 RepID=A0A2N5SQX5_9BASI|nr:hypothetical protein PCASD_23570 [Puccinia coronata f. sp. avenae]